ncbi:MAG TPA: hypothetical protein VFW71_07820 [Actinomycetota bacterium]|nr:hypothetical protein [Actinomycetota bacterium]
MTGGHEFFREYVTEDGRPLEYAPIPYDLAGSLEAALAGRRLQAVVPCCTCGWRGTGIDRSAVDLESGRPEGDPFAQWFLHHMVP